MEQPIPSLPQDFYTTRKKSVIILLGALIFVGIGFMMLKKADNEGDLLIAILVTGFFGLCALAAIITSVKKKSMFRLTPEGIGFKWPKILIRWSDIRDVDIAYVSTQEFVVVLLKDPEIYYSNVGPMAGKFAKMSEAMVGSPVALPTKMVGVSGTELKEWLLHYMRR